MDSDLLVISHHYNHFVKSQVDELSKYYNSVTVFVRYNRFASLSKYFPIDWLKPHSADVRINRDNQPDNIDIIPVPLLYLPTDRSRRRLGTRHANKIMTMINDREIEFDIVHSHFSWTAGYAGQVISEKYDVPHVITVHENSERLESQLDSNNEDLYWAWKRADVLIRVTNRDIDQLKKFNEETLHIPNGYEIKRFDPINKDVARDELGIENNEILLFSLGNLIERKGFHNMISILPEINDKFDNKVTYAIGGHGPKKSKYEKMATELEVENNLILLGYIPNNKLKYWMSAADVFIFPSYSESFGIVQLESMACGTPVVASINGGSEYIINDRVGVLFNNPESHDEFKSAIESALRKNWSEDEITKHADKYTIPSVCEEIISVHQNLLN